MGADRFLIFMYQLTLTGQGDVMPSSKTIEAQMQKILARPEFQNQEDPLIGRILQWLGDWFQRLSLNWKGEGFHTTAIVIWMVTAILLALLIFLLIAGLHRWLGRNPSILRKSHGDWADNMSGDIAYGNAEEAAREGDYSAGIKWLFLCLLWTLHDQKLISLHESKTNRQYIQELRKRQYPYLPVFQNLVSRFNGIRYGGYRAVEKDYADWLERISSLRKGGDSH